MLDGQIDDEEWADAKEVQIDDQSHLLLKEDAHYYYLGIRSDLDKPLYVDLFLQLPAQLFNVHASSQLGQRMLEGTDWSDAEPATKWGETLGWYANEVRFDRDKIRALNEAGFDGNLYVETYFPYDGFEFQFDKADWPLAEATFRLEIRNMMGPDGFDDVVFPQNSKRTHGQDWYALTFPN